MVELIVNRDLALALRPGSDLAKLARLSPHRARLVAMQAIDRINVRTSLFLDWSKLALDRSDPAAAADVDALFLDFHRFNDAVGIGMVERLTHARFITALAKLGLPAAKDGGRPVRRGCSLKDYPLFVDAVDTAVDLSSFLAQVCSRHGDGVEARVRTRDFHAIYRAWAKAAGEPSLTLRHLSRAMIAAGFEKLHSNGRWWVGLEVDASKLAGRAPALVELAPAPPAGDVGGSEVETAAQNVQCLGQTPGLPGI